MSLPRSLLIDNLPTGSNFDCLPFECHGMHRIAAETAQERGMLFQNHNLDSGSRPASSPTSFPQGRRRRSSKRAQR
jgi:hypothetical protein